MKIQPSIRSNIFTNSHPLGCKQNIQNQINEVRDLGTFDGPKNVLIIGGSSGYGLSSRIALAFGSDSNTVNVSYESAPKGKRTGSAGWWNNIYFQDLASSTNNIHKDIVRDAFSKETKLEVINYIKENIDKIDLVIYSLAAGARKNEETGETVRSHLKTIGEPAIGKTIDIAKNQIKDLKVQTATEQEIKDTVYVMGGSDWQDWINMLIDNDLLNEGVKTIAYTYVGGPTTDKIYRGGSMGKAKDDLELKAEEMNKELKEKFNGEALISSSKAVTTKASVFIPQMPVYVSCLYETMTNHGVHESILEHKHRLFKDMVYGENRIVDEKNRIRIDHKEMDDFIQKETIQLMDSISNSELLNLDGTNLFIDEFYQINGFRFADVDYEHEFDLEELAKIQPE